MILTILFFLFQLIRAEWWWSFLFWKWSGSWALGRINTLLGTALKVANGLAVTGLVQALVDYSILSRNSGIMYDFKALPTCHFITKQALECVNRLLCIEIINWCYPSDSPWLLIYADLTAHKYLALVPLQYFEILNILGTRNAAVADWKYVICLQNTRVGLNKWNDT